MAQQQSTRNVVNETKLSTNTDPLPPPPVNRTTKPTAISTATINTYSNSVPYSTSPISPAATASDLPPPPVDRSSKPNPSVTSTTSLQMSSVPPPIVVESERPPPLPPKPHLSDERPSTVVFSEETNRSLTNPTLQSPRSLEFPLLQIGPSPPPYEMLPNSYTSNSVPMTNSSSNASTSESPPPLPPRETFSAPPLPPKPPPQQNLSSSSAPSIGTNISSEVEQLRLEQLRIQQEKQELAKKNQELKEKIRLQQQQTAEQRKLLATKPEPTPEQRAVLEKNNVIIAEQTRILINQQKNPFMSDPLPPLAPVTHPLRRGQREIPPPSQPRSNEVESSIPVATPLVLIASAKKSGPATFPQSTSAQSPQSSQFSNPQSSSTQTSQYSSTSPTSSLSQSQQPQQYQQSQQQSLSMQFHPSVTSESHSHQPQTTTTTTTTTSSPQSPPPLPSQPPPPILPKLRVGSSQQTLPQQQQQQRYQPQQSQSQLQPQHSATTNDRKLTPTESLPQPSSQFLSRFVPPSQPPPLSPSLPPPPQQTLQPAPQPSHSQFTPTHPIVQSQNILTTNSTQPAVTAQSQTPEVVIYEEPPPLPPPSSLPQNMRQGRTFDYYKEGRSPIANYAFKKLEKAKAENKKDTTTKDKGKDKGKTDYIILVVGDDKSGKTSLIQALLHDKFSENYEQTKFELYKTKINDSVVEIWDTGNLPEYTAKLPLCFGVASCIVVCLPLNDPEGFRNIKLKWALAIREKTLAPILVVGTKKDLVTEESRKKNDPSKIQEFADKVNGRYVECSAKTRENIIQVFNTAVLLSADWAKKNTKKNN